MIVTHLRDGHLSVRIVAPRLGDLALDAQHLAEIVRGVIVDARTALDAAAGEVQQNIVTRHVRIARETPPGPKVAWFAAMLPGEQIVAISLRAEQRIRAADHRCCERKGTAGAVRGLRGIAREHELRVHIRMIVDVVVQECAGRVALGLTLQVAQARRSCRNPRRCKAKGPTGHIFSHCHIGQGREIAGADLAESKKRPVALELEPPHCRPPGPGSLLGVLSVQPA